MLHLYCLFEQNLLARMDLSVLILPAAFSKDVNVNIKAITFYLYNHNDKFLGIIWVWQQLSNELNLELWITITYCVAM